jgi:hypothetical protein
VRRLDLPLYWYAEALTSGAYCALLPGQHVRTHLGEFPLPDGSDNPLYLRCTDASVFKMAGQSHGGKGTWEWSEGSWQVLSPSFGVNPHIYDRYGVLRIATESHQGFRYIDDAGRLWTGDETYADPSRRIGEYTTHGDITIGQSGYSCQALYQGKRYVLAEGSARNVIFNRDGNACAVAIHLEGWGTRLLWFDVSELAQFPLESQPEPEPKPDPEPEPEPEKPMQLPDDVFATLQAVRPKYPTPLGQNGAALLNEVAWIHRAQGWGLEAKSGGNVCSQPTTGTTCGCDILRTIDKGWDVLGDTEGAGVPLQSESGPADPARFVAPVPPSDTPEPEPEPEPGSLEERVEVLEARADIQGMKLQEQAAQINLLQAKLSALTIRVEALEDGKPEPPPTYESIYVTVRAGTKTYAGTLPVEG